MQQVNYIDLDSVYPKGELNSQTYKIDRIILSEEDVRMAKFRNTMDGQSWLSRGLKSDFPYVRLYKKGDGIMMSDTPMERNTNESFIHKANGDVLIFGLGLGSTKPNMLDTVLVSSEGENDGEKDSIEWSE